MKVNFVKKMTQLVLILSIVCCAGFLSACSDEGDDESDSNNSTYKDEMRTFVVSLSEWAKGIDGDFIIIPQNGQELVTEDGDGDGEPHAAYLSAIDGVGREDLYYGYDSDNVATDGEDSDYFMDFLDICEENGVEVLATDYCSDHSKMDDSYSKNKAKGYISFAAMDRELNEVPSYPANPYNENSDNITDLGKAKNFLYLLNPEKYSSKAAFISAVGNTNYDVIIMDIYFDDDLFTAAEITQLKTKKNGGTRLVISYMSIGEAEDYRYYWNTSWAPGSPEWIEAENPEWAGNYKVRYWEAAWQTIIFGNDDSYLKKILNAGCDGVYLDIIDAFEYFEALEE